MSISCSSLTFSNFALIFYIGFTFFGCPMVGDCPNPGLLGFTPGSALHLSFAFYVFSFCFLSVWMVKSLKYSLKNSDMCRYVQKFRHVFSFCLSKKKKFRHVQIWSIAMEKLRTLQSEIQVTSHRV